MAMVESYRVGATLELRDDASPAIRALAENAARLEKLFNDIQKAVSGLNRVALGDFTGKLQGINEKLTGIRTNAEGLGAAITRSLQNTDKAFVESGRGVAGYAAKFDAIPEASRVAIEGVTKNLTTADAALAESTRGAAALARELREAGSASRDIPRLPRGGGGGGGYGGGSGGAHPRPGQSGSSGNAHGGNTFGSHGAYIDAGIMGTIGAHEVAAAVEATLHRGMEMAAVQQQMLQGGMSQSDIDRATASAWRIAREDGLDVTKVMDDIKELRLPFGSTEHALEFIDPLEKMRIVLNSVQAGSGTSAADAVYKMARAGELKGLQNPEDFLSYFEGMTKAISASGGKVTPNDFAQATKYGKLSSFGLSEDFYTRSLPTMIQTMGPTTAGQSLQSLFGTLSGSVSQKSFYKIQDLGLISDPSKIVQTKTGIQMQPGAIAGYDEFVKNPLAWAKEYLDPLLEKKFGDISNPDNKEAILGQLQGMFGNRNSAAAVAELALRAKSFDKDAALIDQARGIGGADALLKNDPTAAMNNFSAAWTNMMTAFGLPSVATAVNAMNSMASGMNRIGELAQEHPGLAKNLEAMGAGAAIGLGAIAVLGLAAFAPGGVIAVGAAAFSGAMAALLKVNWDDIRGKIGPGIDAVNEFMTSVRDKIIGAVANLGTAIGNAFSSMIEGVLAKLRAIPGVGRLFGSAPEIPHADGTREGTDRSYHRMSNSETMQYMQNLFPGLSPMAYRTGGSADNDNMVDMLAQGVFRGLKLYASGGASTDLGGAGGGIVNASYGGGGLGGGSGFNDTSGGVFGRISGTLASRGDAAMAHLMASGISREAAAAIVGNAQQESSIRGDGPSGDHGTAHGMFQWRFERFAALKAFAQAHGKPWTDSNTQLDFMVDEAKRRGGAGWLYGHDVGVANQGMQRFERYGDNSFGTRLGNARGWLHRDVPVAGAPPQSKTVTPGRPAGKQGAQMIQARIEVPVHIGSDKVAHHVVHQMVAAMEHPNSVGGPDGYGFHGGPDTALNDAA